MQAPAQPDLHTWNRLKELVGETLERPEAEQEAFLRLHASAEPDLIEEALSLVRASTGSAGVLHPHVDSWLGFRGGVLNALSGARFGKYEVLRLIGEGSAGAVYEARQPGMERPLALKLLRTHLVGGDSEHLFQREVEALGRLEHPGIARIYDAGIASGPDGRRVPFIAMEYVAGEPLSAYVRKRSLDAAAKVALIAEVADAVHAAHQRAVVHRDLKPANVLIDGQGRPKLLDFSIAHIHDNEAGHTVRTTAGLLLGTLGYMSPEQAAGDADGVDVRTDVYALGVILFEILTGRPPVDVRGMPLPAALRQLAEGRAPGLRSIDRRFPEDLQTIVAKALRPEKSDRYASASALADDLRRWLEHRPIAATPPTTVYLARKFVERHRAGLVVAGGMLLLLVAGLVISTIGFVRAERALERSLAAESETRQALDRALQSEQETATLNRYLERLFTAPDPAQMGRQARVIDWLLSAEPMLETELAEQPQIEASLRGVLGWTLYSLEEYEQALRQLSIAEERALETHGERSGQWLEIQNSKLKALRHSGQLEEATEILRRAVPIAAEALPADHPLHISLGVERAVQMQREGRFEQSIALFHELLDRSERIFLPDAPERRSLVNEFTQSLLAAGRYEESIALLESVLAGLRRDLGPDHPSTLSAQGTFAVALRSQGRLAESVELLRHCVEAGGRHWGVASPTTLSAQSELAGSLTLLGDYDEADELYRHVTRELRDRFGSDNYALQFALNNHGTMLLHAGRFDEAADILAGAAEWMARSLGPESPDALTSGQNYAMALQETGRLEEAREELSRIVDLLEQSIGPQHPRALVPRNNLAMIYLQMNQPQEAAARLRTIVADAEAGGGPVAEVIMRRNLARALWAAEELEEAERHFLQVWEAGLLHLPEHQQQRTAAYIRDFLEATGRIESAEEWAERAGAARD